MSKAVFTFGRMNPPTIGHEKLVNKVRAVAKVHNGDPLVYLSHTHNKDKDPIEYSEKIKLGKKAFGSIVKMSRSNTIIKVLQELEKKYDEVVLVVGSDRVREFDELLNKYNGKDYSFDIIKVVSAGERDPDAADVSGMSGTKMRELASKEDLKLFKTGLPRNLQRDAEKIMKSVRKGLNYEQYQATGHAGLRDPERD
jgi:hypothetical protein